MKLSDIVVARPIVEKLANKEMYAASAMEFAEWSREVLTAIQEFEAKRADWFKKYGEENPEKPGEWKIKEENIDKFKRALDRALNKESDIKPFNLSESDVMVSPADIINYTNLFE